MPPLEAVLLLYCMVMCLSLIISFILWRILRVRLMRKLATIWFAFILSGLVQAIWKGGTLGILFGAATAYPAHFLMSDLLAELAHVELNRKLAHAIYAVSLGCVAVLNLLGFGFTVAALPLAASCAFPALSTAIPAFRSATSSFTVRALSTLIFVSALHMLDFPFLRLVESFAPVGFAVGAALVFAFAILAPLTIIEHQRDEFTTLASHELKGPLTSLQLAAGMLEQEANRGKIADPELEAKLKRFSQTTERQVQHLRRLADNLLCATHMRAGLFKLHLGELVDLNALIAEVVDRVESSLHRSEMLEDGKRIRVATSTERSSELNGYWDRFKIDLVVTNLLSNAIKYSTRKPISVELKREGKGASIVIRDEGIGIDDASQKRIFRPYQRAVNAKGYSGMGLGLYVSNEIVKLHGGALTFKSELGRGTEFSVTLPIV